MTFFKILKNDQVVSVGCVFLKWNKKKERLYVCDVNEGQFVQTYDESQVYRDSWMKPISDSFSDYETADVVIIDQTEFDDIKEMINEGETVVVEQKPEPSFESHIDLENELENESENKPMTISEMRTLILEQQKQINILLKRISE